MKNSSDYIDYEDGLKRVGGNKEFYARLLRVFAEGDHIGPIETALSDGDTQAAARATHALKGVSANLSLMPLYHSAVELESNLKNNVNYGESLERLKTDLSETLDFIKRNEL